ncbi:MAG: cellulose biosynthesis cyclic di-GMP-binding regulatory protein BcsB [Sulfitobacter sp.]
MKKFLCVFLLSTSMLATPLIAQNTLRAITLAELGQQVSFEHLSGQQTIFFPIGVPAAVVEATLSLELNATTAHPAERHLKILIDDNLRKVVRLSDGASQVTVPLTVEDYAQGSVRVTLAYEGAPKDEVCIDDRAIGDTLIVSPSSGIEALLNVAALDTAAKVMRSMPADLNITGGDSDPALLLRTATLFGAEQGYLAGKHGAEGVWSTTSFAIDGTTDGLAVDSLTLKGGGATAQTDLASLVGVRAPITSQGNVPLSRFSALEPFYTTDRQLVRIVIDRAAFAPGLRPASATLNLIATPSPKGQTPSATIMLNGEILAARALRAGEVVPVTFDLPERLLARSNQLDVIFQRDASGGACDTVPAALPVQVLPTSSLRLVANNRAPRDFDELYQAFGVGAEVVVADPATDMDWALAAVGAAIPDTAGITYVASSTQLSGDAPFVIVSRIKPEGIKPVSELSGGLTVTDTMGQELYSDTDISRTTIAQLVTKGEQTGLWLRPANTLPILSAARPLNFGQGDIVLIGEFGETLTLNTRAPDAFRLSEQQSSTQLWRTARPWIFGLVWLALTLAVLGGVARAYRSRAAKG